MAHSDRYVACGPRRSPYSFRGSSTNATLLDISDNSRRLLHTTFHVVSCPSRPFRVDEWPATGVKHGRNRVFSEGVRGRLDASFPRRGRVATVSAQAVGNPERRKEPRLQPRHQHRPEGAGRRLEERPRRPEHRADTAKIGHRPSPIAEWKARQTEVPSWARKHSVKIRRRPYRSAASPATNVKQNISGWQMRSGVRKWFAGSRRPTAHVARIVWYRKTTGLSPNARPRNVRC